MKRRSFLKSVAGIPLLSAPKARPTTQLDTLLIESWTNPAILRWADPHLTLFHAGPIGHRVAGKASAGCPSFVVDLCAYEEVAPLVSADNKLRCRPWYRQHWSWEPCAHILRIDGSDPSRAFKNCLNELNPGSSAANGTFCLLTCDGADERSVNATEAVLRLLKYTDRRSVVLVAFGMEDRTPVPNHFRDAESVLVFHSPNPVLTLAQASLIVSDFVIDPGFIGLDWSDLYQILTVGRQSRAWVLNSTSETALLGTISRTIRPRLNHAGAVYMNFRCPTLFTVDRLANAAAEGMMRDANIIFSFNPDDTGTFQARFLATGLSV